MQRMVFSNLAYIRVPRGDSPRGGQRHRDRVNVRYAPASDRLLRRHKMTLWAKNDQSAVQQNTVYSITSAMVISVGGISRPSAFAVVRLMTSSNFVGCSTGRSAGFAPRRILST